ncbi:MAG TPA: GNAT family N-acetyltransferase [Dehalococcoidales bacterium]
MTIKVVKAEEKHVADIGKLWLEFLLFHVSIDPIWTPDDNPIPGFIENHLKRFMQSDDWLVLVALDKDRVVGYSLSEIRRNTPGAKRKKYGYIDQMAVTEIYRRHGVGKKMYDEIVKWLQSNDIKRVELGTTAQNLIGNSFWQKQGFTVYMYTLYKSV